MMTTITGEKLPGFPDSSFTTDRVASSFHGNRSRSVFFVILPFFVLFVAKGFVDFVVFYFGCCFVLNSGDARRKRSSAFRALSSPRFPGPPAWRIC